MSEEAVEEQQTELDYDERKAQAKKIIRNYMLASLVPAAVPVPLLDLALITSIQLKMLHSLSKLYGVKFTKDIGKESIGSLIGGAFPTSFTPVMASLVQMIPVVGQAAGAITMVTLSGAATYAVGKVFVQHFESGGTFLTFNPDKVRDHFAAEMEEGKLVAKEMKKEQDQKAAAASTTSSRKKAS